MWWQALPSFNLLFYCYHFLPYFSVIPAVMLFDPILLGLFGLAIYSYPIGSVWPLVLLLHYLRALVSHLLPLGHPWPICFPWASLAFFPNFEFSWVFTNFFGLPRPNYLISYPWDSWTCYQPLTFFACITLGLLWPIFIFLYHILPMDLLLLSFWVPLNPFASSRLICLFHRPVIHYSCRLGLMIFLSFYQLFYAHVDGLLLSIQVPKMIINKRYTS